MHAGATLLALHLAFAAHTMLCSIHAVTGCDVVQGRNVFVRDMEPFIKWLDEAEEEDED